VQLGVALVARARVDEWGSTSSRKARTCVSTEMCGGRYESEGSFTLSSCPSSSTADDHLQMLVALQSNS
jgi:hypothetical protein